MISVLGIFISTTAMVIVLSAFNGIEGLVQNLFSSFDPAIKITVKEGKTFNENAIGINQLMEIEGVESVSKVIEEITMLKHGDQWITATVKGVDSNFFKVCNLPSTLLEGDTELISNGFQQTVIGLGIQNKLQVSSDPRYSNTITAYGLLRNQKLSRNNKKAFKPLMINVGGVFSINPEFDNQYIITSIDFAKDLLEYKEAITALEIGLDENIDPIKVKEEIALLVGDRFSVKTRYEQNELIFKTNQTEKWMVFLILGFILILSTFNIIASISMLLFDKQKDIKTLISMGATQQFIQRIFFLEGLFINFLGGILGIAVGLGVSYLQIKFHFVKLHNSVINYWPMEIEFKDILLVFGTVVIIGVVSSYLPVKYLIRKQFSQSF
jgi:lipoprotein-releasing system permease protein